MRRRRRKVVYRWIDMADESAPSRIGGELTSDASSRAHISRWRLEQNSEILP
jgi:hypothetical protein